LDAKAKTTTAKTAMTQGFAPATKATMTVTKASTRHTAVTGGMSPSFWVVFLLILLPVLAFLRMFLLLMFLLLMVVLLCGGAFSRRCCDSRQCYGVVVTEGMP
jgi:hypothetical protein